MQKIGRQPSERARPLDKDVKSCWTHLRCKWGGTSLSDSANQLCVPNSSGASWSIQEILCVTAIPDHQPVQQWVHTTNITLHMAVVYPGLCWISGWGSLTALLLFPQVRSTSWARLGLSPSQYRQDTLPDPEHPFLFSVPLSIPDSSLPTETFAPDGRDHHPAPAWEISLSHQNDNWSRTCCWVLCGWWQNRAYSPHHGKPAQVEFGTVPAPEFPSGCSALPWEWALGCQHAWDHGDLSTGKEKSKPHPLPQAWLNSDGPWPWITESHEVFDQVELQLRAKWVEMPGLL